MWKILFSLCYLIIMILCENNDNNNNIENNDILREEIDYLSDLPLADLIKIKKSLKDLNVNNEDKNMLRNYKSDTDNLNDENIAAEFVESKEEEEGEDDLIESRALPASGRDLSSLPLVGGVIETFLNKSSKFNLFRNRNKNNEGGRSSVERSYEHAEHKEPTKIETIFQISVTGLSFLAFGGYLLCMIVQAIKSKGTTYYYPQTTTAVASQSAQPIKKIKVYRRSKRSSKNKVKRINANNIVNEEKMYMLASPSPDDMYGILKLFAEGYVKLVDN